MGLPKSTTRIVGGIVVSKALIEYDHNGSDSTIVRRDDIDIATHETFYNPARAAWTETICPNGTIYEIAPESPPTGCVTINHPGYTAASAFRGNVTKVARMIDVNATSATSINADITEYNHDITGNIVSATLSCCNLKTIAYSKEHEYAFPVSETIGSPPSQLTASSTYNRNTGLALTSTDANNLVTSYEFETDTLRRKKTTFPNGAIELTEYSDKLVTNTSGLLPAFVRGTTSLDSSHSTQFYSYYNGRGLNIRDASLTPDGWSISASEYDNLGRITKSYNSFYGSSIVVFAPMEVYRDGPIPIPGAIFVSNGFPGSDGSPGMGPVYFPELRRPSRLGLARSEKEEAPATGNCGNNPVTGTPGIRDDKPDPRTGLREGGKGNIRPGRGGNGGFHSRGGQKHDATDIVASGGTPIGASMDGTVAHVVSKYDHVENTQAGRYAQNGGLGNTVTVKYDAGFYGYYAHLTNVTVSAGQRVEQGQTVGTAGRTGNANNPSQPPGDDHLHYGRFTGPMNPATGRPMSKKQFIDPVKSLNSPCP